jgi:hypothetical protein
MKSRTAAVTVATVLDLGDVGELGLTQRPRLASYTVPCQLSPPTPVLIHIAIKHTYLRHLAS